MPVCVFTTLARRGNRSETGSAARPRFDGCRVGEQLAGFRPPTLPRGDWQRSGSNRLLLHPVLVSIEVDILARPRGWVDLKQQATFAAIMRLLADRKWHRVQELATVSRYPEQWVRELMLERVIEVSTEPSTLLPIVRIAPAGRTNGHAHAISEKAAAV